MDDHKVARNLRQQVPGRENRYAHAADAPKVAETARQSKTQPKQYIIQNDGQPPFTLVLNGRVSWALDRLREAGQDGCTPITEPAPRWSAYVFSLRALGVEIETLNEKHGGSYPGTHGRYVLRATVFDGGPA